MSSYLQIDYDVNATLAAWPPPLPEWFSPALDTALKKYPMVNEYQRCLFDYEAENEDELTITAGETVQIFERLADNWWKVRDSKGEVGFVPRDYLMTDDPLKAAAAPALPTLAAQVHFVAGNVFRSGNRGKVQDMEAAAAHFRQALEFNPDHSGANFELGVLTTGKFGADVVMIERAAAAGHVAANHTAGDMYYHGQGVDKDAGKAVTFYKVAAEAGHPTALYTLGNLCTIGFGELAEDDVAAADYYQRAADAGFGAGFSNLGKFRMAGRGGLEKNVVIASEHYAKAEEIGGLAPLDLTKLQEFRAEANSLAKIDAAKVDESIDNGTANEAAATLVRELYKATRGNGSSGAPTVAVDELQETLLSISREESGRLTQVAESTQRYQITNPFFWLANGMENFTDSKACTMEIVQAFVDASNAAPPPKPAPPPAAAASAIGAQYAKCTFDYDAVNDGELSLKTGDVLEVTEMEEEGWWTGTFDGKSGVFPSNFVKKCDVGGRYISDPPASNGAFLIFEQVDEISKREDGYGIAYAYKDNDLSKKVLVQWGYQAANEAELTITKGETVQILEGRADKDWWKVRDSKGWEGFVPKNYLNLNTGIFCASITMNPITGFWVISGKAVVAEYDELPPYSTLIQLVGLLQSKPHPIGTHLATGMTVIMTQLTHPIAAPHGWCAKTPTRSLSVSRPADNAAVAASSSGSKSKAAKKEQQDSKRKEKKKKKMEKKKKTKTKKATKTKSGTTGLFTTDVEREYLKQMISNAKFTLPSVTTLLLSVLHCFNLASTTADLGINECSVPGFYFGAFVADDDLSEDEGKAAFHEGP
eukprot:gene21336-9384_t